MSFKRCSLDLLYFLIIFLLFCSNVFPSFFLLCKLKVVNYALSTCRVYTICVQPHISAKKIPGLFMTLVQGFVPGGKSSVQKAKLFMSILMSLHCLHAEFMSDFFPHPRQRIQSRYQIHQVLIWHAILITYILLILLFFFLTLLLLIFKAEIKFLINFYATIFTFQFHLFSVLSLSHAGQFDSFDNFFRLSCSLLSFAHTRGGRGIAKLLTFDFTYLFVGFHLQLTFHILCILILCKKFQ